MAEYMEPPLNITGALDTLAENTLKVKDGFQFAGLWCFSGSQGSGKTLLMMHLLKQVLKESPNAIVVSNISIYGVPSYPYTGIEDFEKYVNGKDGVVFVIDEIHTLFNSLESAKMPLSQMQVWAQNRKNRRLILGTSQRFNRVAKGVREQTTWNYECRKGIAGLIYSYRVFDGALYDDMGKYTEEDPKRSFYIPNVSVMRMYNTLEVVRREKFDNAGNN